MKKSTAKKNYNRRKGHLHKKVGSKKKESNSETSIMPVKVEPPVQRIPPEIWDIITSHVDSSPDLHNLSKAIPICGKLLESKKPEWMFDHVLPVVIANARLTRKDILNCRAVCRRWHYAVEQVFEIETALMQDLSDIANPIQRLGYLGLQRYLGHFDMLPEETTPTKMAKMLKEYGNSPSNPLFGRYLEITIPAANKRDRRLITRFLKTFGHHIYFIDANCKRETHPQVFIDLFWELITTYMPNLKHFGIGKCYWPTEGNWMILGNEYNWKQHYEEKLREHPPLKASLHSLYLFEFEY